MKNEIRFISQRHPISNQRFKFKIHERTAKISDKI